jgi:ligand-binding sensor domain-containing protein
VLAWSSCAFALNPTLDVNQYAHTAWKVRDGFSKGIITSVAQTPDGYLWFGSEFGLLRFDGVRNVEWQPPEGQRLPSNYIRSLLVARDGTLWIATTLGLASWKDGKLTRYEHLAGWSVWKLLEDRGGSVWAGGDLAGASARLCAIQKDEARCYGDDGSLGSVVGSLYQDHKENLWVGVEGGVWRWKPGAPRFYPLPKEPGAYQALGEDESGALLIGMSGGIRRFADGRTEAYELPDITRKFRTRELLRDRDGGLWIGTLELGLVHVHQGRADVYGQADGLTRDYVLDLMEDHEGNVWVSTLDGLDRFRDFAVPTFGERQGLSDALVASVLAGKDGSIWFATSRGLNRSTGGWISIPRTASGRRDGTLNGLPPQSLFEDSRGRIWVSTPGGVGYLEGKRFVSVGGFVESVVDAIAEDTFGNLWISNRNQGVLRLSPAGQIQQIPAASLGRVDPVSAMAADRVRGGVWLGFARGGVTYFSEGRTEASYGVDDGLASGRVNGLRFDRAGALSVATEGGYSRLKDGRIATLSSRNGLPCDAVHWTLEDDTNSFWLYTACGLVRIAGSELGAWNADALDGQARRTIQYTVLDSSDGVRIRAMVVATYAPQVTKSPDGRVWFTSLDGVSVVDPRRLPFNDRPPPVHIEQVTADRKPYDVGAGEIELPALTRDLQIDYTALSLVAPEKMRFRYKLENHDRNWQDVGTRRQAFYNDLRPGTYRFRVTASNNSGVWNETGAALDFSIAPAHYQTWWFAALSAGMVLAVVWGAHRIRLGVVERHERQISALNERLMKAQEQERIRIAGDLHDG